MRAGTSGQGDIRHVVRPAPGCKQDHINPLIVARFYEPGRNHFGSGGHPAQAVGVNGGIKICRVGTPLHLNESHQSSAPGNQIDFTARCLDPPGNDPPTFQPQEPSGERFAAPPLCLAVCAAAHFNSSARA